MAHLHADASLSLINLLKLRVHSGGLYRAGADWRFHHVVSPFNRLYYILAGEARVYSRDEDHRLAEGDMLLILQRMACIRCSFLASISAN